MTYSVKYLRDSHGKPNIVQMSVSEWKKIEQKLREAEFLTRLDRDVRRALGEVHAHRRGKKSLRSARDFLAKV